MNDFFHRKVLSPFMAVLLAAACIAGTCLYCGAGAGLKKQGETTADELYRAAILDAVIAEEEEIFPLVEITPDSAMTEWKDGKVLLATVNNQPDLYEQGKTVPLSEEVWTFTECEIMNWYPEHKKGVTDWTMRLKQLVGVQPEDEYTHVTAMWVSPEDIIRPAYLTDIASGSMAAGLPEDTPKEYRDWFEANIMWSYFDSAYPWTRLGYTYDWAADSGEYGLTEFLVRPGADVEVEYTDTIEQFVERMETDSVRHRK